jgi:hypothetical protein
MLFRSGIQLIKYRFSIGVGEQELRLLGRIRAARADSFELRESGSAKRRKPRHFASRRGCRVHISRRLSIQVESLEQSPLTRVREFDTLSS